jgi:hypothetical protein
MFLTSIKSDYSKIGMLTPAFVKKGIRVGGIGVRSTLYTLDKGS